MKLKDYLWIRKIPFYGSIKCITRLSENVIHSEIIAVSYLPKRFMVETSQKQFTVISVRNKI
jgi:hypothetical protein